MILSQENKLIGILKSIKKSKKISLNIKGNICDSKDYRLYPSGITPCRLYGNAIGSLVNRELKFLAIVLWIGTIGHQVATFC